MQFGGLHGPAKELRVQTWIDGDENPMAPLRLADLGDGYRIISRRVRFARRRPWEANQPPPTDRPPTIRWARSGTVTGIPAPPPVLTGRT